MVNGLGCVGCVGKSWLRLGIFTFGFLLSDRRPDAMFAPASFLFSTVGVLEVADGPCRNVDGMGGSRCD